MSAPHPIIAALAAERQRRNISVAAMARRTGYTPEIIRRWEYGQAAPSLDRVQDYAAALGLQLTLVQAKTARRTA